jgi:hypothetical protein
MEKGKTELNLEEQKKIEKSENVCGLECEIYSRVCGYFRPVRNWNIGKQEEFKERKTFKVDAKIFEVNETDKQVIQASCSA